MIVTIKAKHYSTKDAFWSRKFCPLALALSDVIPGKISVVTDSSVYIDDEFHNYERYNDTLFKQDFEKAQTAKSPNTIIRQFTIFGL